MLFYLILAAFIGIPIIEIALFIQVGSLIGLLPTLGIVVLTAIIGTALLRRQGLAVLTQARNDMDSGRVPVDSVADGAFLLVAGAFLLTPGFFTDAIGFALLMPVVRTALRRRAHGWFKKHVVVASYSESHTTRSRSEPHRQDGTIIEGEAVEVDAPDSEEMREGTGKPDPKSPWHTS